MIVKIQGFDDLMSEIQKMKKLGEEYKNKAFYFQDAYHVLYDFKGVVREYIKGRLYIEHIERHKEKYGIIEQGETLSYDEEDMSRMIVTPLADSNSVTASAS